MATTQANLEPSLLGVGATGESRTSVPPVPTPCPTPQPGEVKRVLGLSVPVTVLLAERDMSVEAILAIRVGTILEFETSFDSDLDLHVANQKIGAGHAVKVGEHFGLRVTRIIPVEERIESLGRGRSSS